MSRWLASALHLGISIVIGLAFFALVRWLWYPGPLFEVSGAVGLLKILIPVDVVLGPLLTLLVFKAGKPSLKFDLSAIAAVQLAALFYGAWVIAEARPAYVVFYGNQLKVIRSTDVTENAPWQAPLTGPLWVGIPSSGAMDAELSDLMAGLSGTKPAVLDIKRYRPWSEHEQVFKDALRPVLTVTPESVANDLRGELSRRGLDANQVAVMPITVRDQKMAAIFEPNHNELVAIVPAPIMAR